MENKIKLLEDYKYALDQSAIVSVTDEKGIILNVNDNFCAISKYSKDELIGKTHRIINSKCHPNSFFKEMWDTITSGKIWKGEIKNQSKDGQYYWVDGTIIPFLDDNSKPYQYLGIRFDISAKKKQEADVLELLGFETLLSKIAANLIKVRPNNLKDEIINAQSQICEFLHFDLSSIYEPINESSNEFKLKYVYHNSEKLVIPGILIASEYFPWCEKELLEGKILVVNSLNDLPAEAAEDYDSWKYFGIKSSVMFPIKAANDEFIGTISFDTMKKEYHFTEHIVNRLKLVAELFGNTIVRTNTENKLILSESKYRNIYDNALEGMYRTSLEGKNLHSNNALAKMLGYDNPETVVNAITDSAHQVWVNIEDRIRYTNILENKGIIRNFECQFKKIDGKVIWVSLNARLIVDKNGKGLYYEGFVEEITQRKKVEKELIENEQILNIVFENSPIGKLVFDKSAILIKANKKAEQIFGLSADFVIGIYNLKDSINFDNGKVWKKINTGFQFEQEIVFDPKYFPYDTLIKEIRYLYLIVTPISNVVSNSIGYIIQVEDITDKKLQEQKLNKAIIQAQENERYEIGGELHDNVCQTLVAAQMNLGILNKSLATEQKEMYNETNALIKNSIIDIRNLSHRLAPVIFKENPFEDICKRLIHTFQFPERIKIIDHFNVDSKKYNLNQQIVLNIYRILQEQLSNIIRHSKATIIHIDIKTEKLKLTMIIKDNGIGFDVNKQKNGIGIMNMKRRAEMFTGKFNLITKPGQGCILRIDIPIDGMTRLQ